MGRINVLRTWKNRSFKIMDTLFEKSLIFNPKNKNKSVGITDQSAELAKQYFDELFKD